MRTKKKKNALGVRIVVRYMCTRLKPSFRHILLFLRLVSALLLAIALGQFSRVDALSHTTELSELEQLGDTVALGCALGGNNEARMTHTVVLLLQRYSLAAGHQSRRGRVKVCGCGVGVLFVS